MTMHLVGPYMTTTNYKKREQKMTKARLAELKSGWKERNQRLKDMGLPKESFEQYLNFVNGRVSKHMNAAKKATNVAVIAAGYTSRPVEHRGAAPGITVGRRDEWITGAVSSKPPMQYTGTKVKGIGTMHKSNAVPIFSDEEATDIARMRR